MSDDTMDAIVSAARTVLACYDKDVAAATDPIVKVSTPTHAAMLNLKKVLESK